MLSEQGGHKGSALNIVNLVSKPGDVGARQHEQPVRCVSKMCAGYCTLFCCCEEMCGIWLLQF